jgi:predicted transcriptional regulator
MRERARSKAPPTPDHFRKALLRNPHRARIVALVTEHPGLNKHQISKRIGLHVNAIEFHMERLIQVGLIETRPAMIGRETLCFTPENIHVWEDPATRILFGRGPPRDVARYITENPGASVQEAADALGVSVHTVRRNLKTLQEVGLVQSLRVERQVLYHAEPALVAWLDEHQSGYPAPATEIEGKALRDQA